MVVVGVKGHVQTDTKLGTRIIKYRVYKRVLSSPKCEFHRQRGESEPRGAEHKIEEVKKKKRCV